MEVIGNRRVSREKLTTISIPKSQFGILASHSYAHGYAIFTVSQKYLHIRLAASN
jgi:hypothetical protein